MARKATGQSRRPNTRVPRCPPSVPGRTLSNALRSGPSRIHVRCIAQFRGRASQRRSGSLRFDLKRDPLLPVWQDAINGDLYSKGLFAPYRKDKGERVDLLSKCDVVLRQLCPALGV